MLNKILSWTLLSCILAVGCFALSLTEVSGNVTISFGRQYKTELDQKIAVLAYKLPSNALR